MSDSYAFPSQGEIFGKVHLEFLSSSVIDKGCGHRIAAKGSPEPGLPYKNREVLRQVVHTCRGPRASIDGMRVGRAFEEKTSDVVS